MVREKSGKRREFLLTKNDLQEQIFIITFNKNTL